MANRDSSTRLSSVLRRFRQRLRLAVFTQHLVFAIALALFVADVVVLVSAPGAGIAATFVASLAFAAVTALALAIARTPSLPDTARIVDRELQLQDRAATALQFSANEDPIARLVVAEAAARLEAVPVSRLPLSVSTPARWLAASALAISLAIVVSRAASPLREAGASGSGRAFAARDAQPPNAPPRRGGANAAAASQPSGLITAPSASSRDSGQQSAATTRVASGDNERPRERTMAQESSGRSTAASSDSASSSSDSRPGASGNATSADPGPKSGSRAPSASAADASGSGAAVPHGAGRAGGGVRGGALVAGGSPAARVASSPSSDRRTAAYARAYARAEAAVPAEHVPAGLQSYVRAYFLAIRPGSNP